MANGAQVVKNHSMPTSRRSEKPEPSTTQPRFLNSHLSQATWAYIALPVTALSFAGNHVVGRAVAGHLPPVTLAVGRWALACLVLVPWAWPHLKRDWPVIRAHWPVLVFLTVLAGGLFSTMQYVGLAYTTALNTALLNSTVPVFIAFACFLLFGERLIARQMLGIAVSLVGVITIIAKGEWRILAGFGFNAGDLIILANMALWSIYSAYLRYRPAMHWLSFGALMAIVALLTNLPFLLVEQALGLPIEVSWATTGAVLYTGIFTSIVAFATWSYGVGTIGAARAGVFLHLIPLFGSGLAIALLGEPFGWFHAAGLGLILAGVWLAAR